MKLTIYDSRNSFGLLVVVRSLRWIGDLQQQKFIWLISPRLDLIISVRIYNSRNSFGLLVLDLLASARQSTIVEIHLAYQSPPSKTFLLTSSTIVEIHLAYQSPVCGGYYLFIYNSRNSFGLLVGDSAYFDVWPIYNSRNSFGLLVQERQRI